MRETKGAAGAGEPVFSRDFRMSWTWGSRGCYFLRPMRILLLTPPMTQLNTPYPATAYLTGFLREHGYDVRQADPALTLVLTLLSRAGLTQIETELRAKFHGRKKTPPAVAHFLAHAAPYQASVEAVVRFLQGKDPTLSTRIAAGGFLPEGPRFRVIEQFAPPDNGLDDGGDQDPLAWAFGALGSQDRAKFMASLYIDDLADVIRDGIDARFELSRYGEKLAASAASFDPLAQALDDTPTLIDLTLDQITKGLMTQHEPDVVGLTVPFPGNVYGAFRIARIVKSMRPGTTVIMGGGYVNTELRSLKEPRVFDAIDFITLDDGERPLLTLLEHLAGQRTRTELLRTYVREGGAVVLQSNRALHDIPLKDAGTPTYDGLALDQYMSLAELLNPMHRLWSDGRWNKLTLAHGCYWRQCSFCDVSLDYIGRYEEQSAELIVSRMEALVRETGQTGFHFVDEAAPPRVLAALSRRLLERGTVVSWWGNVRFEKTFTANLVATMREAGLVAVSGGLEVASDRLLKLMKKGVTVEQVARVTKAFADQGVLVHAYLMYGFPTQTVQETVDALERVRQLFAAGCLHSAFWHRFACTVHSPVGQDPGAYGIQLPPMPAVTFAQNDIDFIDPTGVDHDQLGVGLRKALYNYMHGVGLDEDVRFWFDHTVPKAKVSKNLIAQALSGRSGHSSGEALI